MKKLMLSMAAVPLLVGGLSVNASAKDGINILDDLKLDGQIRPRWENVDDGNSATANANAFTARTKLKVTGNLMDVDGLSASVGIISVNNFGSHTYNSAYDKDTGEYKPGYTDGSKPYAVVGDPQYAMLSNAEINYKIGDTILHAGRGQVNLDNQRFIGTVGWRQLERSYDSVFVANNSIKNLSVLAAWVYGYQGVNTNETADTNTVLLHAAYTVMPELKITAYDYMIANIHDTYGLALTGIIKADIIKLNYRAEYAQQSDATMDMHNANDKSNGTGKPGKLGKIGQADASYYNLDVGANVSGVLFGVNYEYFSGQNASGSETNFSTPLATGHKFNGWADVANSKNGGLIDFNVRLGYQAKGFGKLLAVYHDFTSDTKVDGINDDKGSEIDAVYVNKIPGVNGLTGMLKYADFSKGKVTGTTNDVTKIWAMLDYKFSIK
ncbi:hypothetical protein MNB_SM-7-482 [hydrothermal vent metagenome]|uniref:Alginate export domain-containing protein n=1 Tax=hydrothermal vent metagenome TaxID=652676 RepID=A0A1W1BUE6_9ZZZZ